MSGKPQRLIDIDETDDAFMVDHEEPGAEPKTTNKLTNANDARRRLEAYWEQKALEDELKHIDEWDESD